jgi:hypothetical protein
MSNGKIEATLETKVTEEELIKRSTAERVTLEQVNGSIVGEWYFTGSEAIQAGLKIGSEQRMAGIEDLDRVTICLLKLFNGFIVLGHSAPASAANFDVQIGRRLARERAIMQIWTLLGFDLKTRQWMNSKSRSESGSEPGKVSTTTPLAQPQESQVREPPTPGSEPTKTTEVFERAKLD